MRELLEVYEWTDLGNGKSVMLKTVGEYDDGFYGVDLVDEIKQQHPIQDVFSNIRDARKRYKSLGGLLDKKGGEMK